MKISGAATIPHPVDQVWSALLDPSVLVSTIPGCERLEETAEYTYDMTVTAGVAAIKGTYAGQCALSDLRPLQSLVMRVEGAGAPGTLAATVDVRFAEAPGGTTVSYDADAVVGGVVGGVGQRMLGSVARRTAGEFFGNVSAALSGELPMAVSGPPADSASLPGAPGGVAPGARVFTAPELPVSASGSPSRDFWTGLAVGAGLVALGVILGGRRADRRAGLRAEWVSGRQ